MPELLSDVADVTFYIHLYTLLDRLRCPAMHADKLLVPCQGCDGKYANCARCKGKGYVEVIETHRQHFCTRFRWHWGRHRDRAFVWRRK